jgi:hypothetical protein
MRLVLCFYVLFFVTFVAREAFAATTIPFTVNMSEAVTVNGCPASCPRIAVDVGGTARYATYSAGSGTNTLTFTYQMVSGDVDADGIVLSSPIDLNGGTIRDAAGNDASLIFVPPDTSGILIDGSVPSGYTAAFTDETVTNVNKANMGFQIAGAKVGTTYSYTISSSGGGAPLTGSGTVTAVTQNVNGINLTGLPDGKLTLSVTLTDSLGGVGAAATDTAPMAVLDASLIGHWTFDANDISGVTAYDRSGQSNNGTLTNGPTNVAGQTGFAVSFDGVNDYVTMPSLDNAGFPQVGSLSVWVNGNLASQSLKSNLDSWDGTRNHLFLRTCATGQCSGVPTQGFQVAFQPAGGGSYVFGWTFTAANNVWHHLVIVWDTAGDVGKIYLNNVLVRNAAISDPAWVPNQQSFRLGGLNYFSGQIDNVRLYSRPISGAEASSIYNSEL